jgi:DNA-directed RNA polymerase subunit RPC12/RpoP
MTHPDELNRERIWRCLRCTQTYEDTRLDEAGWCPYCERVTARELVA